MKMRVFDFGLKFFMFIFLAVKHRFGGVSWEVGSLNVTGTAKTF